MVLQLYNLQGVPINWPVSVSVHSKTTTAKVFPHYIIFLIEFKMCQVVGYVGSSIRSFTNSMEL